MLRLLPEVDDPNVLVDFATSDDAAVYRQPDGSLLIASLDFFTPIVNDPYDFGAIAAANALSDIYAMGAEPMFALNIIGFPKNELPLEVLSEILRGGSDIASEAGIFVLGGHSIDDKEPKYGMVVIGRIPDEISILRNTGSRAGDSLILTKPLGTGILNTAIKHRVLDESEVQDMIHVMKSLNRDAAELASQYGANAVTDVTGYGLVGHLKEMLSDGNTSAALNIDKLPVFDRVMDLIDKGEVPGGTRRNLQSAGESIDFGSLTESQKLLVADAQTSGGLLISLPAINADTFVREMHDRGHTATTIIGRMEQAGSHPIIFR